METLSYKGFLGSIEISEEDNCLFGQVLNAPKGVCIIYEGKNMAELKCDFEGAIDDYMSL